jgi:mRNA-degrading endonuclease toxin of MazEF toxin-antitoxin module
VIRQGEVRDYGERGRVVVVSCDVINDSGFPIVVPVVRGRDEAPPFRVALAEQDPIAGSVDVTLPLVVRPTSLGEPAGTLTGGTWRRVHTAVLDLFDDA